MPDGQSVGARRLVGNFGWLAGGEVASRAVGFVIALYLARTLGAASYGAIGIALALAAFLAIGVRAGTAPAAIREVARDPGAVPDLLGRLLTLRLALAGLAIAGVAAALPWLAPTLSAPGVLILLYCLGLVPEALSVGWAYRGLERMDVVAGARVLERTVVLLALVALVGTGEQLLRVPVIEGAAALGVALWMMARLRREYPGLGLRFEPASWRPLLAEGLPVGLTMGLRMLYTNG
ncbi:MAG: oligosaccharide flippase family protein, partial [Proteobacteria bacterium]|nr:oligosaccharide flippase family protein [Pseudomonadota bacterium]